MSESPPEKIDCPKCRGTGWITGKDSSGKYAWITCPKCKGEKTIAKNTYSNVTPFRKTNS